MTDARLSDWFNSNFFLSKICGVWSGRKPTKFYKIYSVPFLTIVVFLYDFFLILNLIYNPGTTEAIVSAFIFIFTEIAIGIKLTILLKRKEILESFDILDSELFKGNPDDGTESIIDNAVKPYFKYFKWYSISMNTAYSLHYVLPVIFHLMFGTHIGLPVCPYYFLDDNFRDKYFKYLYGYQAFSIFFHMWYDIFVFVYLVGSINMAITQFKVINHKLRSFKLDMLQQKLSKEAQEEIFNTNLINCLKHYDLVLKYCSLIQKIISFAMFVQYASSAAIICICMCSFTLIKSSTYTTIYRVFYMIGMLCDIFAPSWLGTQLNYENQELVVAVYNSNWVDRPEKYKKIIRLFVQRALSPLVLTGMKLFPLTLDSFLAIMKLSYSCFTLVHNVAERHDNN